MNRQLLEVVVNIETGARLSKTIGTVEELSTSHDERIMTGGEERRRGAKHWQHATRTSVNMY